MMEITNTIPKEYEDNDAYMNIIRRVSVRRYSDKPVSLEQVSAILHAAMSAPTGVNKQPWDFIVVDDPELLGQLAKALPYAKMTASAPVAIVVCGNKDRFLEGVDDVLWEQDLSAASENILLAAHATGLGGVWTCIYPHEERMARSELSSIYRKTLYRSTLFLSAIRKRTMPRWTSGILKECIKTHWNKILNTVSSTQFEPSGKLNGSFASASVAVCQCGQV